MTMAMLGTNTNGTSLPNEGEIIMHSNNIQHTPEDELEEHVSDSGASSSAEDGATTKLAKDERMVVYARWLVFWVMTAAAILVGVETFKISSKREKEAFLDEVSFGTATKQNELRYICFP
jgi:hypothetical protein